MFKTLKADIDAVMERDPAARSRAEVFFLYSGFKAVRSHRKANWCLRHNLKFLARWISQRSRHKTGIEIHPGATIGKGLFIDHGMGVVIGETTIIGDNCTIYQNVTLGGTGKETGKRHPTLGNNVLVGSGAKVLGPFKVGVFKTLKADIDAVMERDPAARSRAEVFFLYSGFKAVRSHRKANWCLRHNLKFLARWISQRSRHKTGIEIHPGATIGKGLFIDHGMGVVIGETTIIGDNCTIYQNVTLGGTGKETGKRHPTLGNNVLVGSGAKVLGPFKVGDNARIAAGAVVLSEVPPNATAVGVPARVVKVNGVRSETLDQIHVSDPVALALCNLEHKIFELQKQLDELKKENVKSEE